MGVLGQVFAKAAIGAVEKGVDFVVNPPDFRKMDAPFCGR